jgi:D-beta-D-heptose 7-phosphate kinase/D-beta-D-heptose 1-phosphate adenosyltransferase
MNEPASPVDLITAKTIAGVWRSDFNKVGFTNGCFDLIHPGHISLLTEAKRCCGKLIVGINSDASVKRLKGKDRPLQDEHARACVLLALESVDLVVIFDEDDPLNVITKIKPDVLFKGADYTINNVVGAQEVHEYGGEVILIPIKEGYSTSNLIKKG